MWVFFGRTVVRAAYPGHPDCAISETPAAGPKLLLLHRVKRCICEASGRYSLYAQTGPKNDIRVMTYRLNDLCQAGETSPTAFAPWHAIQGVLLLPHELFFR